MAMFNMNDIFEFRRKRLINAIHNKKQLSDYVNEKPVYTRITKQEAESEIISIYDESVFQCKQILCSARALEECCRELLREAGRNEDELMGIYIEKLNMESIKMEKESARNKETESQIEEMGPRFKVITGGAEIANG